jgi:hypothetical protein
MSSYNIVLLDNIRQLVAQHDNTNALEVIETLRAGLIQSRSNAIGALTRQIEAAVTGKPIDVGGCKETRFGNATETNARAFATIILNEGIYPTSVEAQEHELNLAVYYE